MRTLILAEAAFFAVLISVFSGYAAYSEQECSDELASVCEQTPVSEVGPETEAETVEPTRYSVFEATAYCNFGTTYSGVLVQRGIVAADPSILPIGSVIEVEAGEYSGIYTVMDTGGLVKGEIIDIYMPDYEEAIQFGRRTVRIRVLRHGWQPEPSLRMGYTGAG